jgi:hypothetical protein
MLLNPKSNVLGEANVTPSFRILKNVNAISCRHSAKDWLRGLDLNQRPSGYEPDELPGCSTPRLHYVAGDDEIKLKMILRDNPSTNQELAPAVGFDFPAISRRFPATEFCCARVETAQHDRMKTISKRWPENVELFRIADFVGVDRGESGVL